MEKDTLQINAWTAWDLERNFKALEAEDSNADEGIGGAVKNSNLANDGAKVCKMSGTFSLSVTELDPLRNFPSVSCETEVSNGRRIGDWKIASTVDAWVRSLQVAMKQQQCLGAYEAQANAGQSHLLELHTLWSIP